MNHHHEQEHEPVDLMPVRRMDAGGPLRRFWTWDICAPAVVDTPPPRMRSATMESHMSAASSHDDEENATTTRDGLELLIQQAKAALDNLWHGENGEKEKLDADNNNMAAANKQKEKSSRNGMMTTSRENALNFRPSIENEEEIETTTTWSVIVTEPGTSRAMRVYRGLELFSLAIIVLGMTLRLLQWSGVEFYLAVEAKNDSR